VTTYAAVKPAGHLHDLDIYHTVGKVLEYAFMYVVAPHLVPRAILITEAELADEVKDENGRFLRTFNRQMTFGFGIEGFVDKVQVSDQQVNFYPPVEPKSKFSPQFDANLPEEYQLFIDRFEKVVYISFGSIMNPPDELLMLMIEAIEQAQDDMANVGFIFALRNTH